MPRDFILHVVAMRLCGPYSLALRFNDGVEKRVNLEPLLHRGVFERLLDPAEFGRARLDRRWGIVRWPGDLDFAPEALHALPTERDSSRPRRTRGTRGGRQGRPAERRRLR